MKNLFLTSFQLGFGIVFTPVDTLKNMPWAKRHLSALMVVSVTAMVHGFFSFLLYTNGHQPSFGSPLIPVQEHYLFQTFLALPAYLLLWGCFTVSSHWALRRLGGKGTFSTTAAISGYALAVPILVLFLIPDCLAYGFGGFDALKRVFVFSAPVTGLWILGIWTAGHHWAHHIRLLYLFPVGVGAFLISVSWIGLVLR